MVQKFTIQDLPKVPPSRVYLENGKICVESILQGYLLVKKFGAGDNGIFRVDNFKISN